MVQFKYRQLVEHYQQAISAKQIMPGEKLPSVRVMAKLHNVSISTATKVLAELEKSQLVTVRAKSGYFVKSDEIDKGLNFGSKVFRKPDLEKLPLAQAVQYSFNDESILPLSCTGPSTVLDNEALLNKLHRKVLAARPYRLQQDNFELGLPELRNAIAMHLSTQSYQVNSDNVVVTHGRSDALNLALIALGLLNKCVAIEAPSSFFIHANLEQLGIDCIAIPMQSEYQTELDILDAGYKEHKFSAYIFNPNFNDPTGRLLSDIDKQSLAQWAQRRKVILIEYDRGDLCFFGERPKPITHFLNVTDQVPAISIGDFSDTVSFAFSLGYMLCHQCIEAIKFTKHITIEKSDTTSQKMMVELINSFEYRKLLKRLRQQMANQYLRTKELLVPLQSIVLVTEIKGGPCVWLKLPGGVSSEKLFHHLIKHKVAIAPGKMFISSEQFENYFRITFALPWDTRMEEGINTLVSQTLLFLES